MRRIKSLVCLFVIASISLSCITYAHNITTNAIDMAFQGMESFPRPRLEIKFKELGLRSTNNLQPEIRRYAFDKLLAMHITTNTVRFWTFADKKAEYIEKSERMLGMKLSIEELQKIIQSASDINYVSTNNFATLGKHARMLYEKKHGKNYFYVNGMRREYIDDWIRYRDRVLNWNNTVAEYRRKLITFVCRKYHEIHADVPEKERTEALVRFLAEYGFSLPESNASAND